MMTITTPMVAMISYEDNKRDCKQILIITTGRVGGMHMPPWGLLPAEPIGSLNLDEDPQWELSQVLQSGEENGVAYEMCVYRRK